MTWPWSPFQGLGWWVPRMPAKRLEAGSKNRPSPASPLVWIAQSVKAHGSLTSGRHDPRL